MKRSGEGDASVDLERLPEPGSVDERCSILARVEAMQFELAQTVYADYARSSSNAAASSKSESLEPTFQPDRSAPRDTSRRG